MKNNKSKDQKKYLQSLSIGGGVPVKQQEEINPNKAGAEANKQAQEPDTNLATTSLQVSANKSAEDTVKELSTQGFAVQELIKQGLEAKQQAEPYARKIAGVQKRMGKISIADYKGIPIDQALQLMRNDMAQLDSERNYYQLKQQESEKTADELVNSITDMINTTLKGAQYQLTRIDNEQQKTFELAFSPIVLQSGKMPDNLAPQYKSVWEAASSETRRQTALSERGSGGGRVSSGTDTDKSFRSDSANLILQLDSKQIAWPTAYDYLRTMYPEKSSSELNSALGGEWNPQTGENTGRANITSESIAIY